MREQLAAGRIVIDPLDESLIQPSSIDVRIANLFRVFRNHTAGVIDVKLDLSDLTELIEIPLDGVFMLHPGEFVLGSTYERIALAQRPRGADRGQVESRPARAADPLDGRASSTPGSTVTSRSSWRTWRAFRSRSTRA